MEDAAGDRTRPNLKIQDGCNNRCSFCIIPFVRGRSRSAPAEQVVEQVRGLAARYREVVLSGINLGRWGREPGSRMRLADLVRRLLAETEVERLRLSSVEPMDFSDDLLGLMAESPRIAKHVHAPLQIGIGPGAAADASQVPPAALCRPRSEGARADAGCGDRRRRDGRVSRARPTPSSRRAGGSSRACRSPICTCSPTRSGPARRRRKIADAVPMPVRKERNRVLRELAAAKNLAFRERMVGRTLSAVTLHETGSGADRRTT